jgi:hypothetical protein
MPFEHVSLDMITDLHECDRYDVVVVFICMAVPKRMIIEPIIKRLQRSTAMYFGILDYHEN